MPETGGGQKRSVLHSIKISIFPEDFLDDNIFDMVEFKSGKTTL